MSSVTCVLALVLALDVSGSVSPARWEQQRDGHARAFNYSVVRNYIETSGPIAIGVVAFADRSAVLLPWQVLRNTQDINEFSNSLSAINRPSLGVNYTRISLGVIEARNMLNDIPCNPERRVIDVAADGDDDTYEQKLTEELENSGIQVNAIAIFSDSQVRGLDDWMRDTVITSDGFVIVSRSFSEIETAIRRKLEIEILGLNLNDTNRQNITTR